jgi:hypothetical protein
MSGRFRVWLEVTAINQGRTKRLVAAAEKIAGRVNSCISLSNALSDLVGVIAGYFPNPEQRDEFRRSLAYAERNQLLLRTI